MVAAIEIDADDETKPWLVLVHGMSGDHRVYNAQVEAFKDAFRILLVDLPGHGLSSDVAGPYGHAEFAAHVQLAMSERNISKAHYWGTHTGATVGVLLATLNPGQFQSLILEGPLLPGENPEVVVSLINNAKSVARTKGMEAARDVWWRESCWFDVMRDDPERCRASEHRHIIDEFSGAPWLDDQVPAPVASVRGQLRNISCPVLIYNGVHDHPEFLDAADFISRQVPNATAVQIASSGGFPAWEVPDDVNVIVAEFWKTSNLTT